MNLAPLNLSSPGLGSRLGVIGPDLSWLRIIGPGYILLDSFILGGVADVLGSMVGGENWGLEPNVGGHPKSGLSVDSPVALKPVVKSV